MKYSAKMLAEGGIQMKFQLFYLMNNKKDFIHSNIDEILLN